MVLIMQLIHISVAVGGDTGIFCKQNWIFETYFNLLAPELFFNFSTPCIKNLNNTETKYVRIMKQTAF